MPGTAAAGPQAFHQFHESFLKTFEQVEVTVDHVMKDGPIVTPWCSVSVVHREEGAPATFSGSAMGRVEDGRIVEGWNVLDFLSVTVQLNAVDAERVGKLFGG
ncbi:MAG: ester cyclase [Acidobacteriota bacterium]